MRLAGQTSSNSTAGSISEAVNPVTSATKPMMERLLGEMEAAPKSRKWKMRNRVGDRVAWYVLPEEPNEAVDLRAL